MARSKLCGQLLYASWCVLGALAIVGATEAVLRAIGLPAERRAAGSASAWMDAETLALWEGFARRHGIEVEDIDDLRGWRWNGTLRWALRPDLEIDATNLFAGPAAGDAATWTLATNSRGYRTPEFTNAAAPDRLRVVTVGDSNTMGWLLDGDQAYPRRLEAHLADALGAPVEVINLGVGGYTSFSCVKTLFRVALPLEPDALVISCGANDPQRLATSDEAYAARFGGPLGALRFRLGQLRLVTALRGLAPDEEVTREPRVTPSGSARNVRGMFEANEARGLPLVFLEVCLDPLYATSLARTAARHEVPVVDAYAEARRILLAEPEPSRYRAALADVRRRFPPERLSREPELHYLFSDGCHLNALGADVAGAALARELAPRVRRPSRGANGPRRSG
ncbi:MAG: SGNH/GDSL hydrolase family protein [Myxococcota bacterium]